MDMAMLLSASSSTIPVLEPPAPASLPQTYSVSHCCDPKHSSAIHSQCYLNYPHCASVFVNALPTYSRTDIKSDYTTSLTLSSICTILWETVGAGAPCETRPFRPNRTGTEKMSATMHPSRSIKPLSKLQSKLSISNLNHE